MADQLPPVLRAEVTGGKDATRDGHDDAGLRDPALLTPPSGPAGDELYNEGSHQSAGNIGRANGVQGASLRQASGGRQAYAAIDLGTNNCRLLIARPSGENFLVIDAFSRVVRLGEGLAQTGRLSQAAMDRALAALHVCAYKLCRRCVHLAGSVAT
jgi:exopolyphosphatase/guanosine-5'-triphosphate,3'-diphosphate pyrophosphatase